MILDEIVAHKRRHELPRLAPVDRSLLQGLAPCRGFRAALQRSVGEPIKVIAESKKGSPSKGIFRDDYDPVLNGLHYVDGGASCMSVLTDQKYFFGSLDDLIKVREVVQIPLIRKDFIVDERQIAEARLVGADCILLIVACLGDGELQDLAGFARELGLDVLVEVHDVEEAARAVAQGHDLIGVNNRDLRDFKVDIETTFTLLPALKAEGRVVVSESGISVREECARLEEAGVDAILVGETLMRAGDASAELQRLRGTLASL